MASGTLLLASVLLTVGQVPSDVACFNHRNLRIPIGIHPSKRAEIAQLLLFVSSDEGKNWHQEAVVPPENDEFLFYAPADGMYWLKVATVNKKGKQEPEDVTKGPPDQKVLIDTLKPMLRIVSARRAGDEVVVAWEIQEEYPDPGSLKLEYRAADASPEQWSSIPVAQKLIDEARVRPNSAGPLVVRLQIKDLAGNFSFAQAEVPGLNGVTAASFKANTADTAPPPAPFVAPPPEVQPAPVQESKNVAIARLPERNPGDPGINPSAGYSPPPPQPLPVAVPPAPEPEAKVVARSDAPRPPVPPPAAPASAPAEPARSVLPAPRLVNNPELVLEYQLDKVGPSGIGSVELWLTQTDGQTWQRWAEDPDAKALTGGGKYRRTVDLPGEGIYGFRLVVKSKAGRGRPAPVSGDLPELRIEVDTTPPEAVLLEPRPDPQRKDALILQWKVKDRNLDAGRSRWNMPTSPTANGNRSWPTTRTRRRVIPGRCRKVRSAFTCACASATRRATRASR